MRYNMMVPQREHRAGYLISAEKAVQGAPAAAVGCGESASPIGCYDAGCGSKIRVLGAAIAAGASTTVTLTTQEFGSFTPQYFMWLASEDTFTLDSIRRGSYTASNGPLPVGFFVSVAKDNQPVFDWPTFDRITPLILVFTRNAGAVGSIAPDGVILGRASYAATANY